MTAREASTAAVGFPAETLVLIPALNESGCIENTVRRWLALGMNRVRVVDNGSVDGTDRLSVRAGAEVLVEPRRGYGAAAWRGLQDWPSQCHWVLFSSADGSDRLSALELAAFQEAVDGGASMVLGDRTASPYSRRHLSLMQGLGNRLCCRLIEREWGRRFRDMGSLRLVRRQTLESMNLQDRGFGWNLEMQVRALELGLDVKEIPVRYFRREAGQSKISGNLRGSWRAACAILRMLADLQRLRRERPARIPDARPA